MPTQVDARGPQGVLATKGNIVAQTEYGNPVALLGENPDFYAGGTDASTGASAVVTADGPIDQGGVPTGDSGAVAAAGNYAIYAEVTHPSAAAANRQVLIQHRDAGNAATLETLKTVNAGGGLQRFQGVRYLRASERIRLLTGTDATNANIAFKLLLKNLDA